MASVKFSRTDSSCWESVFSSLAESRNNNCLKIGCDTTGANVILCCGFQNRLALHEAMVRNFTNLFQSLDSGEQESLRDHMGNFVFILPSTDILALRSLSELLYTGRTTITSDYCRKQLESFLPKHILLACSMTPLSEMECEPDYLKAEDEIKLESPLSENSTPNLHSLTDVMSPSVVKYDNFEECEIKRSDQDLKVSEDEISHRIKTHRCKFCFQDFPTVDSKNHHEQSHPSDTPYTCNICGKDYPQRAGLTIHQNRVHKIYYKARPHKCDICGKTYAFKKDIEAHKVTHIEGEASFTCHACNKTCSTRRLFDIHMRTHTGEKAFACNECTKCFSTNAALKNHKATYHSSDMSYLCKTCGKGFKTKHALREHEKCHLTYEERKHICKDCDARFPTQYRLTRHIRINHSSEKNYACDRCEMRFKTNQYLVSHMMTHSGEKPFKCKYCEYCARSRTKLNQHERQHTDERPFLCKFCPKKFRQSKQLSEHTMTHTGEKPFSCSFCDYRCIQRTDLKKHEKRHTGKMPPDKIERVIVNNKSI